MGNEWDFVACSCGVSVVAMHARTREYNMHAYEAKENESCKGSWRITIVFFLRRCFWWLEDVCPVRVSRLFDARRLLRSRASPLALRRRECVRHAATSAPGLAQARASLCLLMTCKCCHNGGVASFLLCYSRVQYRNF